MQDDESTVMSFGKLRRYLRLKVRDQRALYLLALVLASLFVGERMLWDAFLARVDDLPSGAPFAFFAAAVVLLVAAGRILASRRRDLPIRSAPGADAPGPSQAEDSAAANAGEGSGVAAPEAAAPPADVERRWSDEVTVLDWVKSMFTGGARSLPLANTLLDRSRRAQVERAASQEARPAPSARASARAAVLRVPLGFALAFLGQWGFERRVEAVWLSLGLYVAALALLGWAAWAGDFSLSLPKAEAERELARGVRVPYLIAGGFFSLLTLLTAGGNLFRASTVVFWALALVCAVAALWEGGLPASDLAERLRARIQKPSLMIQVRPWTLVLLGGLLLAAYFRYGKINGIYYEMWSDHAEKLLDVLDVLNGQYSIFFIRNTGREAIEFYAAAAVARLFGTGISFLTLKIVTITAGFVTLPFIYLYAKEMESRVVGLLALVLAGIAYWPNVISRAGLRFPLYPLFAAPALFYLVRGLRTKQRNDLLLCGLAVGLGLHGYSPARVLPLVVLVGFAIYFLHASDRLSRGRSLLGGLSALILTAFVMFLPLFRFMLDEPDYFLYRMMTRMGTSERGYPGAPVKILASNLWDGLRMFNWNNGTIAIDSIPYRPALDWITGALFLIGVTLVTVRYLKQRDWRDAFTLLSIPVLILPSVLSLAFPSENPAINRASGAIVPVFTLAALPLAALPGWARRHWDPRRAVAVSAVAIGFALGIASVTNYHLVFDVFSAQLRSIPWNTTEAGEVVRGFAQSTGSYETAYVVPYPFWMDTRLVGIHAGTPDRDYALFPDQFEGLQTETRAQLFLLKPEDTASLEQLRGLFPNGTVTYYHSEFEGKDFIIFYVPGKGGELPSLQSEGDGP